MPPATDRLPPIWIHLRKTQEKEGEKEMKNIPYQPMFGSPYSRSSFKPDWSLTGLTIFAVAGITVTYRSADFPLPQKTPSCMQTCCIADLSIRGV
jgi:hypothetical protein